MKKTTYPGFELKPDTESKTLSFGAKAWALLGLVCCLQFLFFGMVGVIRGYSVQSSAPFWVMLAGIYILLFSSRDKGSYLSSGLITLFSVISMLQGRHESKGDDFYDSEKYIAAISEYEKELDTWYLRLQYNHNEENSMFGIAQCYSQLGEFEKSRETYAKLSIFYGGYYKGRAEKELVELDENLKEITDYEQLIENENDDGRKARHLFDLALVYRGMPCSQKANEQYRIIESLDVRDSVKEQARTFASDWFKK